MSLVMIDAIEGRGKQQLQDVLDETHRAVVYFPTPRKTIPPVILN